MTSLPVDVAEWELLVGKAIIRFGEIELISLKCLAFFSSDQTTSSDAKLRFVPRAKKLVELLKMRQNIDQNLEELIHGFEQARRLASTRNLIAHNPVMLDLYVNEDKTESRAERWITSARSASVTIDLADLKEFYAEVDDLASTLWMHFARASGSVDSMFRTHKI